MLTPPQPIELTRRNLSNAANRLTEAHRSVDLDRAGFDEVLETFIIATRAYHNAIRTTNEHLRKAHHDRRR